ncbi:UDP-glycosyltransferase 91C1-like [Prosopis cineraria]|uniref:UDP-glycosyltransferase 91C1-like n=1 Tax=Prosopis cineraria TaxID=364024 RepID=UPI00240F3885|nr:UDP-glycosyltransferase 91C1-like [Prosopis cineraria]
MAKELHVVMLPWSAFGHMMPFFQLSIALAKFGVRVSFVTTPRNVERLPKVPSSLASLIALIGLPLPHLQNGDLPRGAEASTDVPFHKIPQLKMAYDLLQDPFQKFVAHQSPDWIIIDFMSHWAIDIAQELQIPVMYFSAFSAATTSFVGPPEYLTGEARMKVRPSMESLMSPPPWVNFPSSVAKKKHEAFQMFKFFFGSNGTPFSDVERLARVMKNSRAIALRTCCEFEGPYLDLLQQLHGKPVIPTGFLPPDMHERTQLNDQPWKDTFKWLDDQKPRSVVFIGFGSECKLSKEQIHEIAHGLELSDLPFIWALREPEWAKDETEFLPPGFAARTRGKGIVTLGWAPQLEILSHESIGGSLFHAGWGSMIEILGFGHSLALLPMIADQGLNARLLVEKGLAVEIERAEDGSFSRDGIAKALKIAMVLEEGEPLRVRAKQAAPIFRDMKLQHEHYIGQLVQFLKSRQTK